MFLCNVLARFVKAEINSKPILWVLLLGLLVLSSSNVSSERLSGDKRATVCMQSGSLSIKCPGGHIEIQNAFYTHATDCSKTAESGSCDQYSIEASIQLSTACNDKPSCSFQPPSIGEINGRTLDGSIIDANPPQCGQGGKIALGRFPTNAFGATYKCKEYSICSAMNTTAAGLRLRTEYFPELVTTNPTCECTYAAETGYTLELLMSCTGAVAVVTEEYYNGMSKPITRNYYCEDSRKDSLREYVGSRLSNEEVDSGAANAGMLPHKIGFKVEISRSSETSSYEIIPTLFTSVGSRAPKEAKALISCVDGGLYLRYSVRIALYITIPLVVIIIIALIVVRCLFKRRREDRQWEREYLAAQKNDELTVSERQDLAADGKSTSTTAEPEPWHSNPEVSPMNELERDSTPRRVGSVRTYLHHSHTAIPSMRGDNIVDPRLSRSRHSVRSLNKRRAPRPPGPPPAELLRGTKFLQPNRNIRGDDIEMDNIKRRPVEASAPSDEDLQYAGSDTDNRGQLSHRSSDAHTPLIINIPPNYSRDNETDSPLSSRRRNTDFDPGDTGETLILPRNDSLRSGEGSVSSLRRYDVPNHRVVPERHQVPERNSPESDAEMTIMRPGVHHVNSDAAFPVFDPSISAPDEYNDQDWLSDGEEKSVQPAFGEADYPGYDDTPAEYAGHDEAAGGYNNDNNTFSQDLDY